MVALAIAAAGVAAQVAGTVIQAQGQRKAAEAQKKQQALQANRDRRAQIRQAQAGRAAALSAGGANGVNFGDSSIQGGIGGINSQATANIGDIGVGEGLGARYSAGMSQANLGSAISSVGGMLVGNAQTIGRVGTYAAR